MAKDPDMRPNPQGGVDPKERGELDKAKEADLVTLPKDVEGTNCGNCKFFKSIPGGMLGMCEHPELKTLVTPRMCCKYWDSKGTLRAWKK